MFYELVVIILTEKLMILQGFLREKVKNVILFSDKY